MAANDLLDVDIPEGPFHECAFKIFSEHGKKIALVDGVTGASYTYEQLNANIRRVASGLNRLGVKKGDIVAIFSTNNPEFAFVFYAILATGATVTTINPTHTVYEVVHHLTRFHVRYLYTIRELSEVAVKAIQQASTIKHVICHGDVSNTIPFRELLTDDGSAYPQNVVIDPREDVATLPTSSGTTGPPKGVMITHYNIMAQVQVYRHPAWAAKASPSGHEASFLAIVPFYHGFGMFGLLIGRLLMGIRLVTLPKFEPELFFRTIDRYKITHLPIVPPIVVFMAKSPMTLKYDLSSVHHVYCGAAPLARDTHNAFITRLGVREIHQGYGLTETTAALTRQRSDKPSKPGSSGHVVTNTRIQIVDTSTGRILGANERGELWAKGPQIMKGYWDNPEATKEILDAQGWIHTGDIGYYDDEGYVFVVDRMKELIKYKGLQVAPAELEALILNHTCVADVGVIGVPDPRAGELPKAFIVKKPDAIFTKEDLLEYMQERAANYKQLRGGIEFVSMIPKSPSGKILRRELRKMNSKI